MELLQWLRSILRRSLRAKDTALRWLFTILRLLLHSINRGKNPSDKDTPPSNASQSLDPIGNTVVICPSELPAHTPYAANIDASKSPEIAETTRIQRSRNETPSQFPSALTPPSPCTLDPSSTGNKHSGVHASAMFTALEASTYEPNIESSPDLDLSQQTLRGGTPSTASIRTRTTSARSTSRRQSATPPQDGTEAPDAAALPSPQTHCTPAVSERPALALSSQNQAFWSIAPERLMRYDRIEENLIEDAVTEYEIPPPFTTSIKSEQCHDEWEAYIHPKGARYFKHKTKRVFTDTDMCNSTKAEIITSLLQELEEFVSDNCIIIAPTTDLVLDLVRDKPDNVSCDYYFADHKLRSIFWLDVFQADWFYLWDDVKGVTSPGQVAHIIESQYWCHCQLYPTAWPLSIEAVDDLRDMLSYTIGAAIISPLSTALYKLSDMQNMLNLADSIRVNVTDGHAIRPGMASSLFRFMYIFACQRFIHFYGEPNARLERNISVYKKNKADRRRTMFITILAPLLFFEPRGHVRSIQKFWVDGTINDAAFERFIEKLLIEWQDLILVDTVLLNANVAFLAIQSVDEGTYKPQRSAAQLASYVSVVTVMGSLIIGLLLVRQNREGGRVRKSSDKALHFMRHKMLGVETLAIVYSLPYALLIWAVLTFLAAFTLMCIIHSSLAVRLIVSIAWSTIALTVLWCILISWKLTQRDQHWFMLLTPNFLRERWPQLIEMMKLKLQQLRGHWKRLLDGQETAVRKNTVYTRYSWIQD